MDGETQVNKLIEISPLMPQNNDEQRSPLKELGRMNLIVNVDDDDKGWKMNLINVRLMQSVS